MSDTPTLPLSPYLPFDPSILNYNMTYGHLDPVEFSGWKSEVLSWKTGCYLHAGLNPPTPYKITGPDAIRLFSDACVNSFAKFSIGGSKHAIMCNAQGNIMAHGMLLRTGEDCFESYFLAPYISYLVDSGKYDVKGEDMTGQVFMFQIAGPRSLELLETAIGEDLHDIKFLRHRTSQITLAGGQIVPIRVVRIGMAGTLAYEVHGSIQHAQAVHAALTAVGEPFGLERLGMQGYGMNHTENGFPQVHIHFLSAWQQDPNFIAYLGEAWDNWYQVSFTDLKGSAGNAIEKRYCTPIELGWGHVVKFDHDFIGRAALEKEAAAPTKTMVTLVWNPEDVLDVYASHLRPGEEYEYMDFLASPIWNKLGMASHVDDVRHGADEIGVSMGRIYSYYYRAMVSLCAIDSAHSAIGTQVEIIWGAPGTRQKKIRATVERFPYLDLPRNEKIDVNTIPRLHAPAIDA